MYNTQSVRQTCVIIYKIRMDPYNFKGYDDGLPLLGNLPKTARTLLDAAHKKIIPHGHDYPIINACEGGFVVVVLFYTTFAVLPHTFLLLRPTHTFNNRCLTI